MSENFRGDFLTHTVDVSRTLYARNEFQPRIQWRIQLGAKGPCPPQTHDHHGVDHKSWPGRITAQKQFSTQKSEGPKMHQNTHFETKKLQKKSGRGPSKESSHWKSQKSFRSRCFVNCITNYSLDLNIFVGCRPKWTKNVWCVIRRISKVTNTASWLR